MKQGSWYYALLPAFLFFAMADSFAQTKQVCLTIDDLPVVSYGMPDSAFQSRVFNGLLASLKQYEVPAIGFVNGNKLYHENRLLEYRVEFLERWADQGLDLGNHTFSHPDYNKVTFAAFTADLLKGETIPAKVLHERGKKLKYFRHPFLHVGNTKAKADSLDLFLAAHGYTTAPVTIDTDDYLFALAYHRAWKKGDTSTMRRAGEDYLAYMELKLKYYEGRSQALFGREIRHILLIHASLLNSHYLGALIRMYRSNGYTFVSLGQALDDPTYQTAVTVYGNWGISWIDRWALSQGKKGDFFAGDPEVPEYIKAAAK